MVCETFWEGDTTATVNTFHGTVSETCRNDHNILKIADER